MLYKSTVFIVAAKKMIIFQLWFVGLPKCLVSINTSLNPAKYLLNNRKIKRKMINKNQKIAQIVLSKKVFHKMVELILHNKNH